MEEIAVGQIAAEEGVAAESEAAAATAVAAVGSRLNNNKNVNNSSLQQVQDSFLFFLFSAYSCM